MNYFVRAQQAQILCWPGNKTGLVSNSDGMTASNRAGCSSVSTMLFQVTDFESKNWETEVKI